MILTPRVSEKTYALANAGSYVFNVPMSANKQQIMAAIKQQYGVEVADVRTVIVKGKAIRAYRGARRNPVEARRSDTKKAYVTLVEGASLDLFNQEGEEKK